MLQHREFNEGLLTHLLTPAGPIPTVYDSEGVYPYPSYVESSHRPVVRTYRFVELENEHLRVTICPDLGGKVHSMVEKKSKQSVLFVPESIHPVRILPRMAFVPGGIEVSFPISHSPVQMEPVEFRSERAGDRMYVWCGERELHTGMQWTVEYSLGISDHFLAQRTCFRNPTPTAHPWMSWSNAAVPARPDSEFHFPNGPVLVHGAEVETIDWLKQGPRRLADLDRMTGYFWLQPNRAAFGVFTPSLGMGLYHMADPRSAPGMKLWSYGLGRDERWGRAACLSGDCYIELQGGPIRDQSIRNTLFPGTTHSHLEFWMPSSIRLPLESLKVPAPDLLPVAKLPWFDWPERPCTGYWRSVLEAFADRSSLRAPPPPALHEDLWAPRAMDELGDAIRWLASTTSGEVQGAWLFQLGAWLSAGGEIDAALQELARSTDDRARALAARLYFRALNRPDAAALEFRAVTNRAFALHPQVAIERDLILAAIGEKTLDEREQRLSQCSNSADEWVRERMAALLLDQGKPREAQALLEATAFQLVHQRYVRIELWNRIQKQLKLGAAAPANLGEDDLAVFGAYRQTD